MSDKRSKDEKSEKSQTSSPGNEKEIKEHPKPTYRPIEPATDRRRIDLKKESSEAIQRRIREGLPAGRKAPTISNQIEIYFSEEYLTNDFSGTSTPSRKLEAEDDATNQSSSDSVSSALSRVPSLTGIFSSLGAGRANPFQNYPILMNKNERWLMDRMYLNATETFNILRQAWLPLAITAPASFHQFLANLAVHIFQNRHDDIMKNPLYLFHHSKALELVNKRIEDPVQGTSDDVITSVVILIRHSILIGDFEAWRSHMRGLKTIVTMRGGIKSIEKNKLLSRLIYCVDVSGAVWKDQKPQYSGLESHFQELQIDERPKIPIINTHPWLAHLHLTPCILNALDILNAAVQHTRTASFESKSCWQTVEFILDWIDPVIHRVSGIEPTLLSHYDTSRITNEVVRLGIILFLAEIRRKCGIQGIHSEVYIAKQRNLLVQTEGRVWWDERLLLWVLFFGAYESVSEDRRWYTEEIWKVTRRLGVDCWQGVLDAARGFLWFDGVFEVDGLRECVAEFADNQKGGYSLIVEGGSEGDAQMEIVEDDIYE